MFKTFKRAIGRLSPSWTGKNVMGLVKKAYRNQEQELIEKIQKILEFDESDIPRYDGTQEEQALPGMKKYRATGYDQYMMGRYLYRLCDIRGKQVLDSGCGLGWGTYLIAGYTERILGIDICPEAIQFCQENWSAPQLSFKVGSVTRILDLNESFDVILSFELVEHLLPSDVEEYLNQSCQALSSKGILFMSSSFPDSEREATALAEKNKYHPKIYTKNEITRMAKAAGFKKVSIQGDLLATFRK